MKTRVLYTAAALALVALAGCGRSSDMDRPVMPTASAQTVQTPAVVLPDPENGMTRDDDGLITDGDTGRSTLRPTLSPAAGTARPGTAGTVGSPSPSASPSASPDTAGENE